jgi:hypothetical protein
MCVVSSEPQLHFTPPEQTPGTHCIGGYCSGYKIDEKSFASAGDQTCYPNNEDMSKGGASLGLWGVVR